MGYNVPDIAHLVFGSMAVGRDAELHPRRRNQLIKVIGEITADTFRQYMDCCENPLRFSRPNERDVIVVEDVLICSPGGDIGYTLAMLDDIDEHKRPTRATGVCQSAAAVLATAGEGKRVCTMDALFRFVPPDIELINDPATGKGVYKVPDLRWYLHTVLVARLAQRLKRDKVEVYELFDGEFISSTRAKELGLVDEVISTEAPNGNSNRLSGSEREDVEFEECGYDDYAPSPTGSGGEVRVQPDPEVGPDSDDIGWPI